jgi:catechol 2,3-dioxygenase
MPDGPAVVPACYSGGKSIMFKLQQQAPARLHHLHVVSDDPARLAAFYEHQLDLKQVGSDGLTLVLAGPSRAMTISPSGQGFEPHYGYALADVAALARLREALASREVPVEALDDPMFETGAFLIADPQGRRLAFGLPQRFGSGEGYAGRLQHTVFQTTELERVVRFYVEQVGFTISDEVVDEYGAVMTVFMRSDDEHHTLAFFRGSANQWDHHCYETSAWNDIRDWGDRFAAAQVPIFFGPGRHGPGNNLFFMVTDPDGNRLEFSAELQRVDAHTPPGVWPHAERTLNSWGRAWVRT